MREKSTWTVWHAVVVLARLDKIIDAVDNRPSLNLHYCSFNQLVPAAHPHSKTLSIK